LLNSFQKLRRRGPVMRAAFALLAALLLPATPWSRIIAVNANTGDIAWQTTLGTNPLLPEGKRNAGGSGSAGPIVTAGGLVFIGAATDNRFRAFDSKSGKELWAGQLERQGNAVPVT